jgi:hypothetical protein
MPNQYLNQWTGLKTKFEADAGKKIAAIEKKKPVKKKVSELREKAAWCGSRSRLKQSWVFGRNPGWKPPAKRSTKRRPPTST